MDAPLPLQPGETAGSHPHTHSSSQSHNQRHSHEPNPAPPVADPTLTLARPDGTLATITVDDLIGFPQQSVDHCYIVSTGHGTSGPFRFEGVTLDDLFAAYGVVAWHHAEVISADDFGTHIQQDETHTPARPILLAITCDGKALTRAQGLVRLIVPHERDDALRQVKWVARIIVY